MLSIRGSIGEKAAAQVLTPKGDTYTEEDVSGDRSCICRFPRLTPNKSYSTFNVRNGKCLVNV